MSLRLSVQLDKSRLVLLLQVASGQGQVGALLLECLQVLVHQLGLVRLAILVVVELDDVVLCLVCLLSITS